jgi:hypothetical protein
MNLKNIKVLLLSSLIFLVEFNCNPLYDYQEMNYQIKELNESTFTNREIFSKDKTYSDLLSDFKQNKDNEYELQYRFSLYCNVIWSLKAVPDCIKSFAQDLNITLKPSEGS